MKYLLFSQEYVNHNYLDTRNQFQPSTNNILISSLFYDTQMKFVATSDCRIHYYLLVD